MRIWNALLPDKLLGRIHQHPALTEPPEQTYHHRTQENRGVLPRTWSNIDGDPHGQPTERIPARRSKTTEAEVGSGLPLRQEP